MPLEIKFTFTEQGDALRAVCVTAEALGFDVARGTVEDFAIGSSLQSWRLKVGDPPTVYGSECEREFALGELCAAAVTALLSAHNKTDCAECRGVGGHLLDCVTARGVRQDV